MFIHIVEAWSTFVILSRIRLPVVRFFNQVSIADLFLVFDPIIKLFSSFYNSDSNAKVALYAFR